MQSDIRSLASSERLSIGAAARMDVPTLERLIGAIQRGYQVIGPTLRDGAICYGPIEKLGDLPAGWTSEQNPGSYRLKRRSDRALFGYATGPKGIKNFLHVSEIRTFTAERTDGPFRIFPNSEPSPRYAFLGVRGCDIAAMFAQDRVLLQGIQTDCFYEPRRRKCLIIAVHCTAPANTCFCTSMGTGPRAPIFDLALTELADSESHEFLVEVGSEAGAELLE